MVLVHLVQKMLLSLQRQKKLQFQLKQQVPGLSNDPLPGTPINARGAFGSAGGISSGTATNSTHGTSGGGGGAKEAGADGTDSPETGGAGGEGLLYNVAVVLLQ